MLDPIVITAEDHKKRNLDRQVIGFDSGCIYELRTEEMTLLFHFWKIS